MLTPEQRAEMDAQAELAEAMICGALFELLMAQQVEPMDKFIQRVSATIGHA